MFYCCMSLYSTVVYYCTLLCFYYGLLLYTVFYYALLCFTVFCCFRSSEQEEMDSLVKTLPSVESLKGFKMYPQEFEKVGPIVMQLSHDL